MVAPAAVRDGMDVFVYMARDPTNRTDEFSSVEDEKFIQDFKNFYRKTKLNNGS